MANQTTLSFCISTYNRVGGIVRLVNDILSCPDTDIEVVVLDNGSTDETSAELAKINDNRFNYFNNGTNKGALYSMVNVLEKGRGKFLVFSTDKDFIDFTQIPAFKEFLTKTPELSAGFCCFENQDAPVRRIFNKGAEGIKNIAYKGRHPTGYFFRGDYLRSLGISKRFADYAFVDLFPLEFALAELCVKGTSAIYDRYIFKPASGRPPKGQTSLTTKGRSEDAFFAPRSRLKLTVNYTKHLLTLDIPFASKIAIAYKLFSDGLVSATFGYRTVMNNENLCVHYDMEMRQVGFGEIVKIAWVFIRNYYKRILGQGFFAVVSFLFLPVFFLRYLKNSMLSKLGTR